MQMSPAPSTPSPHGAGRPMLAGSSLGRRDAEIKVIQDSVDAEWMRTLHVMSLGPLDEHKILRDNYVRDGELQLYVDELKLHHLVVRWPIAEAVRGFLIGAREIEWPVMVWALRKGDRVSAQIKLAAQAHWDTFAKWPEYAWMRKLPTGTEDGMEVSMTHCQVMLITADWVPSRCMVVGSGKSSWV